jgi:excinuclease ABC subunit C
MFNHKEFLKTLTAKPGVYRMLDEAGQVIYVGKARNLKRRVASYFTKQALSPKTRALVEHIDGIEVTVTHTELEALLLENNLIKQLRPRYNVNFRDDKSYPYLYLSIDETYPRLMYFRGAQKGKGKYFGPFPDSGSARGALHLTQTLFRIRQCDDSFFRNRSRPCLQYQIKRCTAPCTGLIGAEEYRRDVTNAMLFLQGRNEEVIKNLAGPMQAASAALEFERAAAIRDQIAGLRKVQETQHITKGKGEIDIIACIRQSNLSCIQLFMIRNGRLLGNKAIFPNQGDGDLEGELIGAFISQHYLAGGGKREIPHEILTSDAAVETDLIETALSHQAGRQVRIRHRLRGERAQWMRMASENAELALRQKLGARENIQQRFANLAQSLNLDDIPERIECFDISHTGGENPVASCVVFNHNGAVKADYRRFNIRNITLGDDYAAMRQALERRYSRVQKEAGKLPDLILIDGGKGQLSEAEAVLREMQLDSIPVVGVAKGVTRKAGNETLVFTDARQAMHLAADSPALHLIQEIRDEAHRFAITGHRQRRGKQRNRSVLEDIEGIGAMRRQQLIRYFGGLQGITRAGIEDLAKAPGINKNLAEKIYNHFHAES